jgi:transcriptional regulator with XRE-family HTH domain
MNERDLVKDVILKIFNKSGYTDSGQMTQRDFDYISSEIEKKSGILISGTTIKRLALGDFSRLPQVATLNAIANYFDYKTWQDFKTSRSTVIKPENEIPSSVTREDGYRFLKSKLLYFTAALLVVFVIFGFFIFKSRPASISNAEKATFSCQRSTRNDIPNTVIFTYDIDQVHADSFFIQQSWDKNRRRRIYKNTHTITDIYYEPGYHIARLIANDSIIKTIDVHIPTDRWFFYAIDNMANYIPEYIKTNKYLNNGVLGLSVQQVKENNIDITKDKLYHYTYFPGTMTVKSNNFRLKTRIRMNEVRNSLCPYITIELFCQGYFILMKTTNKGCANKASLLLGREIKGNETDLTALTFDISQWTDVEIVSTNNIVSIYINNKAVFSAPGFERIKYISGFAFISNGLCEVDNVELTGPDGKIVYKNEF